MRYWLVWDGKIYTDGQLRSVGWTDEHLRAPHAWPVRKRVFITDRHGSYVSSAITEPAKPVTNFESTHTYIGWDPDRNGQQVYLAEGVIKKSDGDLRITTFSDGHSMYVLTTEIEPITNERDELIDDIESLCLAIKTRQDELSRLVKKLKG